MSRFTVLVIGENPETQLAPYLFECECSDEDDQYVVDLDETEVHRKQYDDDVTFTLSEDTTITLSFTEYCIKILEIKAVHAGEIPDLKGEHKYGYCLLNEAGNVVKVIRRTNPNKKFDWYEEGGLSYYWSGIGFFHLRDGTCANSASKRNIDFALMRSRAETMAALKFDAVRAVIEPHLPVMSWPEVRKKYCPEQGEAERPGGIKAARQAYHAQPAVKALSEVKRFGWEDIEDYTGEREEFIKRAGISAYMTFAVVKDGKWYERGEIIRWGDFLLNEKDESVWGDEFAKLIDGLPEDTLLSVYLCHICHRQIRKEELLELLFAYPQDPRLRSLS